MISFEDKYGMTRNELRQLIAQARREHLNREGVLKASRVAGVCLACGVKFAEMTPGCELCAKRHERRTRAARKLLGRGSTTEAGSNT